MSYWLKSTLLLTILLCSTSYAEPAHHWVAIGYQDDDMHPVLWMPMARAGDPQAQFNVGLAHFRGEAGYKLDDQKALHWFTLSAEQQYPAAENNLAILYALGRGVPRDNARARHWFQRATSHRRVGVGYENLEKIDQLIAGVDVHLEPAAGKEAPSQQNPDVATPAANTVFSSPFQDTYQLDACTLKPDHFTLQLIGATSRDAIAQYVQNGDWQQATGYVHTQREGKDWFVVIYGNYSTRTEAAAAKRQLLSTSEKVNPWLRNITSLTQYCSSQASK